MVQSRTRWYEFSKKKMMALFNVIQKEYWMKKRTFYREIYLSKNTNPESNDFKHFCDSPHLKKLDNEEARSCEGLLTIEECSEALSKFPNNKTPDPDSFTIEFYRCFWNAVAPFMVDSFNYSFENGLLTISQWLAMISLIPTKDKNLQYLKNWRPVSLLNNDYKIATKAIALRLEKVLPKIVNESQTGYVKGRYIRESIRTISDIMSFTKTHNIPGLAVFLDFEKEFDSLEWNYLQKCLEVLNFGPQLRRWIRFIYSDISSCVLNNRHATRHFNLGRGVRQGCPLSGTLFVIGIEILGNAIRSSKEIKRIKIDERNMLKLSQYTDDTTAFVEDTESLSHLFSLLSQFESCFGLKLNQSKLELLRPSQGFLGTREHG